MKAELIAAATGKFIEPKHSGLIYSKMDLIKALNHYSCYSKPENLRAWSMTYLHKHHPELVKVTSSAPMSAFDSYGALCRLSERGYDHPPEMKERIRVYFAGLKPKAAVEKDPDAPAKPVQAPKNTRSREAFELGLDELLLNGVVPTVNLIASESHRDIKEQCERGLLEVTEAPEYFDGNDASNLKKFYKATLEKIAKIKQGNKVVVKPNKSNPAKMIKDVKFLRRLEIKLPNGATLGLKSVDPIDTLERKKMYVFDAKYRRLIVFVASASTGFMYAGTTLKNVDLAKSFSKTIRKPEEFFPNTTIGVAELNKAFAAIKSKETLMVSARFNPDWLILKVTEKGA